MDGYRLKLEHEKYLCKCRKVESLVWRGDKLVDENTKLQVNIVENHNMIKKKLNFIIILIHTGSLYLLSLGNVFRCFTFALHQACTVSQSEAYVCKNLRNSSV